MVDALQAIDECPRNDVRTSRVGVRVILREERGVDGAVSQIFVGNGSPLPFCQ